MSRSFYPSIPIKRRKIADSPSAKLGGFAESAKQPAFHTRTHSD